MRLRTWPMCICFDILFPSHCIKTLYSNCLANVEQSEKVGYAVTCTFYQLFSKKRGDISWANHIQQWWPVKRRQTYTFLQPPPPPSLFSILLMWNWCEFFVNILQNLRSHSTEFFLSISNKRLKEHFKS